MVNIAIIWFKPCILSSATNNKFDCFGLTNNFLMHLYFFLQNKTILMLAINASFMDPNVEYLLHNYCCIMICNWFYYMVGQCIHLKISITFAQCSELKVGVHNL